MTPTPPEMQTREALPICPFCGSKPESKNLMGLEIAWCTGSDDCPISESPMSVQEWSMRAASSPFPVEACDIASVIRTTLDNQSYIYNAKEITELLVGALGLLPAVPPTDAVRLVSDNAWLKRRILELQAEKAPQPERVNRYVVEQSKNGWIVYDTHGRELIAQWGTRIAARDHAKELNDDTRAEQAQGTTVEASLESYSEKPLQPSRASDAPLRSLVGGGDIWIDDEQGAIAHIPPAPQPSSPEPVAGDVERVLVSGVNARDGCPDTYWKHKDGSHRCVTEEDAAMINAAIAAMPQAGGEVDIEAGARALCELAGKDYRDPHNQINYGGYAKACAKAWGLTAKPPASAGSEGAACTPT